LTARNKASVLALLIGASLVAGACGSAATAPTPTTEALTQAPPTAAPPSIGLPGFSFTLPSFTPDAELEALFPDAIGGETLKVTSMAGTQFLAMPTAGKDLGEALTQLGKTPADLSVAFAGTMQVIVFAFRIKGVPADQFFAAYSASVAGGGLTDASYGGKAVKKVVTTGQPAVYLYLNGEILWTIASSGTAAPTDALLNEVFSKLP
jgi:hypothetical protein